MPMTFESVGADGSTKSEMIFKDVTEPATSYTHRRPIVMDSGWEKKALARWRRTKKSRRKLEYIDRRRGYLACLSL